MATCPTIKIRTGHSTPARGIHSGKCLNRRKRSGESNRKGEINYTRNKERKYKEKYGPDGERGRGRDREWRKHMGCAFLSRLNIRRLPCSVADPDRFGPDPDLTSENRPDPDSSK
jgi:hypothetical protein